MARIRKSLAERMGRWRSVLHNEELVSAELPHLMPDLEKLRQMEQEARELMVAIDRLKGELRATTVRLRDLARRADRLRTKMGAGLRAHFGFESTHLIRFGFRPRQERGGPFLRQPQPEPTSAEPAAALEPLLVEAPGARATRRHTREAELLDADTPPPGFPPRAA